MNRSLLRVAFFCCTASALLGSRTARAEEPVDEFVDALVQSRMYDEALNYLDGLKSSRLATADVKASLGYRKSGVLIQASNESGDLQVKQKYASRAEEQLKEFLASNPPDQYKAAATLEAGNLQMSKARIRFWQMKSATDADRPGIRKEAAEFVGLSQKSYQEASALLASQLKQLPTGFTDDQPEVKQKKTNLQRSLVQAALSDAQADYDLAMAQAPGDADRKARLLAAAKKFAHVNDDYRTQMAGLSAKLMEGRSYQQAGDYLKATACFGELIRQDPTPEFRTIIGQATRCAMECWTTESQHRYLAAAEAGEAYLDKFSTAGRRNDSELQAIRFLTALAYERQAMALPEKDAARVKLTAKAKTLAELAGATSGEYQKKAQILTVSMAGPKKKKGKDKDTENAEEGPKTFAEAYEAAKEALDLYQTATQELEIPDNDKPAAELKAAAAAALADAKQKFQRAIALVDEKSALADVKSTRYFLGRMLFEDKQFYDAAVYGEFVAHDDPQFELARPAAGVAFAAYGQLMYLAKDKQARREFAVARMRRLGEFMTKNWPDSKEAAQFVGFKVRNAVQEKDVAGVRSSLQAVPADAPGRLQLELTVGQFYWSEYLRQSGLKENRPPQAELDKLREEAATVLKSGVDRSRTQDAPDAITIAAMFYLAQIQADSGKPAEAIKILEDEQFGPLTLLIKQDEVVKRPGFDLEIRKLALRSYVATGGLDKAMAQMDALEQSAGSGDAKNQDALLAIYTKLGQELKQSIDELRKAGNVAKLKEVSEGFEKLMSRLSEKPNITFTTLVWIGETFERLGESSADTAEGADLAKEYYKQAEKTYARILETEEKAAGFVPKPEAIMQIRLRQAKCQSRGGDPDSALHTLTLILADKPNLVSVQLQAADIFMIKGEDDPINYVYAIKGSKQGYKDNVIWGFHAISLKTQKVKQFQDAFFQARLAVAECRYRGGKVNKDARQRIKVINAAKQEILTTYAAASDFGGDAWRSKFDELMKKVQAALGEPETGLAALPPPEAGAAPADAGAAPTAAAQAAPAPDAPAKESEAAPPEPDEK